MEKNMETTITVYVYGGVYEFLRKNGEDTSGSVIGSCFAP